MCPGAVGEGVLLDSDLGNMVDLVVGLVTDCGSRGNMVVGHRSNSNSGGSSLHLDSLDSSNSCSSNCVVSNGGSVGHRVNKANLVDIFRESLQ